MTWQPISRPYERRCARCGALFSTAQPGAAWTNRKTAPRYIHPGCEQPKAGWKPAPAPPG